MMPRTMQAVLVALLATACASAVRPRFHSLMATRSTPAAPPASFAYELLPITIPAQVDRPQWVVRAGDGTLAVLENERWIAPLASEMQAAIAERLGETIGASRGAEARRIRIDVQRFDTLPGNGTRLEADWSVSVPGGASLHCRSALEQAAGSGFPALAEAHRKALRTLADAIGTALSTHDAGRPATCR